jgi:exonuclease SbcC
MWIKGVRVENVGPHRKIDLTLTLGSVGVFGANGSGKSTLIDLVYSALTNDFGRFACAKADLVNLTAEPKAPAYVEVDAEHDGTAFTVRRALRGKNAHLLTFHDGRAENNHTDARVIADELARLGIDKRLLDFAVFKPQNKVYEFIDALPSVRGKAYQVLNRTEECEQFYEVLGDMLKLYGQYGSVVDNSDELQTRLTDLDAERAALLEQKAGHEGIYLKPEHKQRAEQLVEAARRHQQRQEELTRVVAEVKTLFARLEPVKADAHRKWNRVAGLQTRVAEARPHADAARDTLRRWDTVEAYRRAKKKLDGDAAEVKVAYAATVHKPAVPAPSEAETRALRVEAAALIARLNTAQDRFRTLTAGTYDQPIDSCPTCGQSIDATEGAFAAAKADVVGLPGQIDAIETDIKRHEALRRAWVAHNRAVDVYNDKHAQHALACASLPIWRLMHEDKRQPMSRPYYKIKHCTRVIQAFGVQSIKVAAVAALDWRYRVATPHAE